VDAPSTTRTSRSPWSWASTEAMHDSIVVSSSRAGITTETSGRSAGPATAPADPLGALAHDERLHRANEDHDVAPERPVLDVLVVEPDTLLDRGRASEAVH